jgi:hypothetical protein
MNFRAMNSPDTPWGQVDKARINGRVKKPIIQCGNRFIILYSMQNLCTYQFENSPRVDQNKILTFSCFCACKALIERILWTIIRANISIYVHAAKMRCFVCVYCWQNWRLFHRAQHWLQTWKLWANHFISSLFLIGFFCMKTVFTIFDCVSPYNIWISSRLMQRKRFSA